MKVRTLQIKDYHQWDVFIEESPQYSIFGYTWYLDALAVDYSILVVEKSGTIIAGMILTKMSKFVYTNALFCKYLGVFFQDDSKLNFYKAETERRKSVKLLLEELKSCKIFSYTFHLNFEDYLPFYFQGYKALPNYTYRIDLKQSEENIFSAFYTKLKSELKFALKSDYYIDFEIDFTDFYEVVNKTFLRQGSKAPFSQDKLLNFYDNLKAKNAMHVFGIRAKKEERLMCVAGLVTDKSTAYLILNGIDAANIKRGANELLLWEAIKFSKSLGLEVYDFEGSMLENIESFYRKFGGDRKQYLRIAKQNSYTFLFDKAKVVYKKIRFGK